MYRRAGLAVLAAASLADGAGPAAGGADPPRRPRAHRLTSVFGFVGEEPVPELRVLAVRIEQGVRPRGRDPIGGGDRLLRQRL